MKSLTGLETMTTASVAIDLAAILI